MIAKAITAVLVVAISAVALSQAKDEEKKPSDRDRKLIEKYPEADKNKDGVLSDDELQDLKKSMRKNKGATTTPSATAGAP